MQEEQISSEQILDGKLLKVFRDEVRLPDGGTSVREWVKHPGASAVVPLFEDGSTLLVRQFRYPPRRTFLEVPAGKLDREDEDPAEVAARELEEETGWKATRFTPLGSFYPTIGYSDEVIHYFLAEGLTRGTFEPEEGETLEPLTVAFDEALAMVQRGEIRDMKSYTALSLAARHLDEREREVRGKKLR